MLRKSDAAKLRVTPADIRLDSRLVGREREKQLVETPYMLPRLDRTVLREVLRECQYQALAVVQHIDFLTLLLRKAVRTPQRIARDQRTERHEHDAHRPYLPEARFDILQTFKFHVFQL